MILVDSSVWIDYFRGIRTPQTDNLDRLLGTVLIATGDLVLMEVLQGFATERDFNRAEKLLTSLCIIDIGGRDIAIKADTQIHRHDYRDPLHRGWTSSALQRQGFQTIR